MIIQMILLREFETPPEEYREFLNQCRNTHLISEMMDALFMENMAPDVEITSLIANGQAESDLETKTSFVGSVEDVNILVSEITEGGNRTIPSKQCSGSRPSGIHHQQPLQTFHTDVNSTSRSSNSNDELINLTTLYIVDEPKSELPHEHPTEPSTEQSADSSIEDATDAVEDDTIEVTRGALCREATTTQRDKRRIRIVENPR